MEYQSTENIARKNKACNTTEFTRFLEIFMSSVSDSDMFAFRVRNPHLLIYFGFDYHTVNLQLQSLRSFGGNGIGCKS